MRKVRGFKLTLRPHELRRRAKKAGVALDHPALAESSIQKTLDKLAKTLVPGVLYETYGAADPDQALLSPMPGLAYSLILATLGSSLDSARVKEPTLPATVWPLLEDHALDECVRFASILLQDEAEKDNCELSPLTLLTDAAALAAARKLDSAKIGVSAESDGGLDPAASRAASLAWLAKSRAKGRR